MNAMVGMLSCFHAAIDHKWWIMNDPMNFSHIFIRTAYSFIEVLCLLCPPRMKKTSWWQPMCGWNRWLQQPKTCTYGVKHFTSKPLCKRRLSQTPPPWRPLSWVLMAFAYKPLAWFIEPPFSHQLVPPPYSCQVYSWFRLSQHFIAEELSPLTQPWWCDRNEEAISSQDYCRKLDSMPPSFICQSGSRKK